MIYFPRLWSTLTSSANRNLKWTTRVGFSLRFGETFHNFGGYMRYRMIFVLLLTVLMVLSAVPTHAQEKPTVIPLDQLPSGTDQALPEGLKVRCDYSEDFIPRAFLCAGFLLPRIIVGHYFDRPHTDPPPPLTELVDGGDYTFRCGMGCEGDSYIEFDDLSLEDCPIPAGVSVKFAYVNEGALTTFWLTAWTLKGYTLDDTLKVYVKSALFVFGGTETANNYKVYLLCA